MEIRKSVTMTVLISFLWSSIAMAAPDGGSVAAGQASISQQGNLTQITQTTQNAVINWQSFDTSASEHVNFTQPNAQAIALNRITSGMPTKFAGLLTANGRVWIVNPAGVFFTGTSKIDAAGLLATTLDIKNSDFIKGNYHFSAVPGFANTSVINNGEINTIQDNGLVALVAPGVANNGVIRANASKVILASGTDLTLDLYGDNLISFAAGSGVSQTPVDQNGKPLSNAVSNSGTIEANNNGQVLMTANAAEKVVQNVVSMTGVIEAKNAVQTNSGVVILGGTEGVTHVGGKIYSNKIKIKGHKTVVDGVINTTDNGFLETSGDYLDFSQAQFNFGAHASWLIDPEEIDIVVSGPCAGTCLLQSTLQGVLNGGTDVTVQTTPVPAGSGDINVDASITWNSAASLSLIAIHDININQPITQTGGFPTLSLSAGNQINLNTNSISVVGAQHYFSPVFLVSDANLIADGLIFESTIDGAHNLNMTSDSVNFVGNIGSVTPLSSLTLNERAINLFTSPVNSGNAMQVNTTGDQTYNYITSPDGIYVGGASVNFSSTFGTVTFNNPLRGNFGVEDVTVSGKAAFLQPVGDDGAPLNNLTVTGNASVFAGLIKTTGTQTYQSPLLLGDPATQFQASSVTFDKINGNAINPNLTVIGDAVFNGNVGDTTILNSMIITGQATINTPIFYATTEIFQSPVVIKYSGTTNLGAGSLTFDSTLDGFDGTQGFVTSASGTTTFGGAVGSLSPLFLISVNNNAVIQGGSVEALNQQNYSNVFLTADTVLKGGIVGILGNVTSDLFRNLTIENSNLGVPSYVAGTIDNFVNNLYKKGSGTLLLANDTNGFAKTFIQEGVVSVDSLGSNGLFTIGDVSPLGRGDIEFGTATTAGKLIYTGSSNTYYNRSLIINDGGGSVEVPSLGVELNLTNLGGFLLQGTGDFTKTGLGILTLYSYGSDTWGSNTGRTVVDQGTLKMGSGTLSAESASTLVIHPGATVDLSPALFTASFANLEDDTALTSGTLGFGASFKSFSIGNNNLSSVFTGTVVGSGNLSKEGTGQFTFNTDASGFTGNITVNGGAFKLDTLSNLGTNISVQLNNNSVFDMNDISSTFSFGSSLGTDLKLGSNLSTTLNMVGSFLSVSGDISGAGNLTIDGPFVIFDSPLSFTGTATLKNGAYVRSFANTFSNSAGVDIQDASTWDIYSNASISNLTGTGNIILEGIGLTVDYNGGIPTTFSGQISDFGLGGSLIKEGTGELVLSGVNLNYSGTTLINNGTLTANQAFALGDSSSTTQLNGAQLIINGADIQSGNLILNGGGVNSIGNSSLAGNITLLNDTFFTHELGSQLTLYGTLNGPAATSFLGAGTISLTNAIGNVTPLASLATDSGVQAFISSSHIITGGDQNYFGPVTLINNVNFSGNQVSFHNTLDGFVDLTVSATNGVFFNGLVGSVSPLNSIAINDNVGINGDIITSGAQTYNGLVTLPGSPVSLTGSDVTIGNGVIGVSFLSIDAVNASISGPFSIGGVTVTGTGVNNSLSLNTTAPQTWNMTGADSGSVSSIGSFSNIQNVTGGGIADTFIFTDGATIGSVNGGSGSSLLDLSGYLTNHPVSVIMTNLPSASGNAYSALIGNQIDTNSPITAFNNITTVRGNSHGLFQVPAVKGGNIIFNNPITPISSTQFLASGLVTDPINFEDFLFFFAPSNPIPNNIPDILKGTEYPVFDTLTGCVGDNCQGADVVIITSADGNEAFERTPIGNVGCLYGFAEAVSSTGSVRILLPGDPVYADDKIVSDSPTCIKPDAQSSMGNSDKQACMTNQN